MTHTITLQDWPTAHATITKAAAWIKARVLQGRPVTLTVEEERRSSDQNRLMWDILAAFSEQKLWIVNGVETQLDREDWKALLTAAFAGEASRIALGVDGGVVMLGARTSRFSKTRMSEFIDYLQATAADMGVSYDHQDHRD